MPYITSSEYEEFGFGTAPTEFDKLLKLASDEIDFQTRFFYLKNDIESDQVTYRVMLFKKAVAAQIKYFEDIGASSIGQLNAQPSQISIGRTSISNGNKANSNSSTLSADTLRYLSGTGLLYRGL